jgi:hypothetical protein
VSYAYARSSHESIVATLALLRHFRSFLGSSATAMLDPYEVGDWGNGANRLDKPAAQRKLTWLVNVAVNRKAGMPDVPLNHRGKPARRALSEHQIHLRRDFYRLQDMAKRIRVYQFETPEVQQRFGHRLADRREDY